MNLNIRRNHFEKIFTYCGASAYEKWNANALLLILEQRQLTFHDRYVANQSVVFNVANQSVVFNFFLNKSSTKFDCKLIASHAAIQRLIRKGNILSTKDVSRSEESTDYHDETINNRPSADVKFIVAACSLYVTTTRNTTVNLTTVILSFNIITIMVIIYISV